MSEFEAAVARALRDALAHAEPDPAVEAARRAWQGLQGVKCIAEAMQRGGGPSDLQGWPERAACALLVLADSALANLREVIDGPPMDCSGGATQPELAEQSRAMPSAPLLRPLRGRSSGAREK